MAVFVQVRRHRSVPRRSRSVIAIPRSARLPRGSPGITARGPAMSPQSQRLSRPWAHEQAYNPSGDHDIDMHLYNSTTLLQSTLR